MINEELQENVSQESLGKAEFNPDEWGFDESSGEKSQEVDSEVENEKKVESDDIKVDEDPKEGIEDKDRPPSKDIKDDSSLVVVLGDDLYKEGVLSSFDEEAFKKIVDEKGEAEGYRHLIKSELEAIKSKTKELYDGEFQEYTRLRESGFSSEQATQSISTKSYLESINDDAFVEENSEELIKNLMTAQLKQTSRMNDDEINDFIQYKLDTVEDGGIEEGKKALKSLKDNAAQEELNSINRQKEYQANQDKLFEERKNDLKKSIDNSTEFIKDVKIEPKIKDKMYSLLTDVAGEIDGQPVNALTLKQHEDSKAFSMKLAYIFASGYFDSDKPWDKLSKAAQTKESSRLDKLLSERKDESFSFSDGFGRGNIKDSKNKPDDYDDFLHKIGR